MQYGLLISSIFLVSCSNSSNNPLASSDSLAIQFKSIQSGEVIKMVSTRDEKAIRKLADFINSKADKEYKCSYDGMLSFYSNGMPVGHISFNYSQQGCHHFSQTQGDTIKTTKMSNEAADFLKGLAEGKSWY